MVRHCLLAFLLMYQMICMRKPMAVATFFEKTQYPNGTVTCALDKPSLVIPLDQLSNGDTCVAPGALCALQCLQDSDCTNYNYRNDPRTCEIYHYTPTNCSSVIGCYHAEVSYNWPYTSNLKSFLMSHNSYKRYACMRIDVLGLLHEFF